LEKLDINIKAYNKRGYKYKMDSYILCGMQYGDEAKGSFVDWLTHHINTDCIVKYNGGAQASHTVVTPEGITHKFSQLGSGMFKQDCHTYITKDMIVSPDNIIREMELFAKRNGESFNNLKKRVHIHKDCLIITPYHKLMNRLRELSLGSNRRGSVGTGVSEVPVLRTVKLGKFHAGLGITMGELFNINIIASLEDLQNYTKDFLVKYEREIWENCPSDLGTELNNMIHQLLSDKAYLRINEMYNYIKYNNSKTLATCLYDCYENTLRQHDTVIWEGSQGILIDKEYGIAPNTTKLTTINEPALNIAYLKDDIHKIGIAKAFCSRHGEGIFPTEDKELKAYINDPNQDISYWNGFPRYGWFDAVLFRYANRVNKVNQVFMSSFDKLSELPKVKICIAYQYHGKLDKNFNKIFSYHTEQGSIIIDNIKHNNINLKQYLSNCTPVYEEHSSWDRLDEGISKEEFLAKCGEYIKALEENIKVKITVVSVGATRNNKIVLGNIHKKSRA